MSIILRVDGLLGKMTGTVYRGQVTGAALLRKSVIAARRNIFIFMIIIV
jgi:hypothetical protein